ncbi:MAG: ATPase, T2SS/T4P/T4SS family [Euryarchaeota archaeon]|nr:ATPase, T2SS/T4P/T4SS family [Euryarchaeota archaeon]
MSKETVIADKWGKFIFRPGEIPEYVIDNAKSIETYKTFSKLAPLMENDNLEEIMIDGVGTPVFVFHKKYGACKTNIMFDNDVDIYNLAYKIASTIGRRIDRNAPLLDARIPGGYRVNVATTPVAIRGTTITIRKLARRLSIYDLLKSKTLDTTVAAYLWVCIEGMLYSPLSTLFVGPTASGKTTIMNAFANLLPQNHRVVSIEDIAEINLPYSPHWVQLESRPPEIDGTGAITMNMLLINALRMRPDRIIVGEVRGEEAYTLFAAMNVGHKGVLGTLHCNSVKEVLARITSPPMSVPVEMASALDLLVMLSRYYTADGIIRRVFEIAELAGTEEGMPQMNLVYRYSIAHDTIKDTGVPKRSIQTIASAIGLRSAEVIEEIEQRKTIFETLLEYNVSEPQTIYKLVQAYYQDKSYAMEYLNDITRPLKSD